MWDTFSTEGGGGVAVLKTSWATFVTSMVRRLVLAHSFCCFADSVGFFFSLFSVELNLNRTERVYMIVFWIFLPPIFHDLAANIFTFLTDAFQVLHRIQTSTRSFIRNLLLADCLISWFDLWPLPDQTSITFGSFLLPLNPFSWVSSALEADWASDSERRLEESDPPPLLFLVFFLLLSALPADCVSQRRGDYSGEWQARRLIPYPLWITDQPFLNDSLNTCCRLRVFTGSAFTLVPPAANFCSEIGLI